VDLITGLLSARSAPATPPSDPDDLRAPLSRGVRAAGTQALVTAAAASDRPSDPTFSSETPPELSPCEPNAVLAVSERAGPAPATAAASLSLDERGPAFLFAGEMSYAAAVDILADAIVTVCQRHQSARFVFVGDGPLKSDVEAQVSIAGFAHRCRFTGDLPSDEFDKLLVTCDVVVVPARESQDSGLAERALSLGKPVLTTHQAQVSAIVHGKNGLVA
jgi:glycosyltransferase involved in cell wall biosynthesis